MIAAEASCLGCLGLCGAGRERLTPPLHPVLPAAVAVSHGPWCLCWALGRAATFLLLSPAAFWVLGAACFPLVFEALGRGGSRASCSPWTWEKAGENMEVSCGMLGVGERMGQSIPPVRAVLTPLESPQLIL